MYMRAGKSGWFVGIASFLKAELAKTIPNFPSEWNEESKCHSISLRFFGYASEWHTVECHCEEPLQIRSPWACRRVERYSAIFMRGGVIKLHRRDCFAPINRRLAKTPIIGLEARITTLRFFPFGKGRIRGILVVMLNSWRTNEAPISRDFVSPSENSVSGVGWLLRYSPVAEVPIYRDYSPPPDSSVPTSRDWRMTHNRM